MIVGTFEYRNECKKTQGVVNSSSLTSRNHGDEGPSKQTSQAVTQTLGRISDVVTAQLSHVHTFPHYSGQDNITIVFPFSNERKNHNRC